MKLSLIIASGLVLVLCTLSFAEKGDKGKKEQHPVFSQKMKSLKGKKVDLGKYKGKVLLIVNTASKCGNTPQYKQLEELHEKYSDKGLKVLGFPCNQFGKQEPGSGKEILAFCEENYGVKFDMFAKIDVNGKDAAPLYKFLTSDKTGLEETGPIHWNFEKFLIDRHGKVVARFQPKVKPDTPEVIKAIETELDKK